MVIMSSIGRCRTLVHKHQCGLLQIQWIQRRHRYLHIGSMSKSLSDKNRVCPKNHPSINTFHSSLTTPFDFEMQKAFRLNLEEHVIKVKQHRASGLPIVHEDKYVCEFPIKHRFCMRKFHGVLRHLRHDRVISMKQVLRPDPVCADVCKLVHTDEYIDRFFNGCTSKDEQRLTGIVWSPGLVSRCRYETGGTILACQLAIERGLACSTGGGTHHAHASGGSGYCFINDMAIAASTMIESGIVGKVLIVDLDVHQGDGTASILKHRHDVFTLSVHCQSNFPFVKQSSDLDIGLKDHIQDKEYLHELESCLPWVLDTFRPDLIIYDAGVDPHVKDELGRLDLTDEGLYNRDFYVLDLMRKRGIPAATVIGGGYSRNHDALSHRHTIVHRAASQVWMQENR